MRVLILLAIATAARAADHWVGTWAASPSPQSAVLNESDLTIREIVHTSIGGKRIQIRFTNVFGTEPLTIAAAHVAIRSTGSATAAGSDHALTFGGRPAATIPPAAILVSDPIQLDLPAQSDLAISVYVPGPFPMKTMHAAASQTSYLAPGDLTAAASLPSTAKTMTSWPFLCGVAVEAPEKTEAIVTFGDSITDGSRSTTGANARWPDVLARRLQAVHRQIAVLNAVIGGNRILHDGQGPRGPAFGPSGLSRFDRDVISHPGVKYVIVMEGINDLGHPGTSAPESETVTTEDIIFGLRQLIERAHAAGLKIFGATLTPFEVASSPGYDTSEREAKRQAINQWIRTSAAYDGVIDFEKAVRDPEHPSRSLAQYDSGDHLHPNDAGYKAMGESINLNLFK
jgi:lysophospholipase L1-like esterase